MKTKMIVTSGLVAATLVFSSFALAQGPGRQGGGSAANGAANYQRGPAKHQDMRGDTKQERIRLQDQLQKKEQQRSMERERTQDQLRKQDRDRTQERLREHQPEDAQKRTRQQSGDLPEQASDTARAAREYSGQGQGTAEAVHATQDRVQRQDGSDATAPVEQ